MHDPTPEEVAESEEFVGHVGAEDDNRNLEAIRLDREHIQKAQEADEVLHEVWKWVKGTPPKSREEIRGMPEDAHVYYRLLKALDIDEGGMLI